MRITNAFKLKSISSNLTGKSITAIQLLPQIYLFNYLPYEKLQGTEKQTYFII